MSPCRAITAYQHNRNVEWLPHIRDTIPEEALGYFKKLHAGRQSPLGTLCQTCDWWIMFKRNERGETPSTRTLPLPDGVPAGAPAGERCDMSDLEERPGTFGLDEATASNGAIITGDNPVCITTTPQQWAFAALFPIHDSPEDPLTGYRRMIVRVEATVEEGLIGISIVQTDLRAFIAAERHLAAGSGRTTAEITLNSPRPGIWLVIRNIAAGGSVSRVRVHSISAAFAPDWRFGHSAAGPVVSGFVPLEDLTLSQVRHMEGAPRPEEVWLDVGAHLGEKTLSMAAQNPWIRVYAFEPNLKVASTLMGRLSNYVVLPMAVAEQDGSAPFYLNRDDASSSLLPLVPEGLAQWVGGEILEVVATLSVPTIRLDTFLNQAGILKVAYLKIDAQGSDLAVVRSAGERLKDIERICLEVQITPVPLYRNASQKQEVVEFLTKAGFKLVCCERQSYDQEENLTFVRPGATAF